jgi:hypothetical protein
MDASIPDESHGCGMAGLSWTQTSDSSLITCGSHGRLTKVDYRTMAIDATYKYDSTVLTCLAVDPQGRRVAVGDEANFLKVRRCSSFLYTCR